jgi:hypothetical protein
MDKNNRILEEENEKNRGMRGGKKSLKSDERKHQFKREADGAESEQNSLLRGRDQRRIRQKDEKFRKS